MAEIQYAVSTLYGWFNLNKSFFLEHGVDIEFRDSGHGSAYVRIETELSLSEAIAWDHASCLNIQIIEIKTEDSKYLHEGSCYTKEIFESHLEKFLRDLESEILQST